MTSGTATPPTTSSAEPSDPAASGDGTDDATRRRSLDRTLATGVAWLGLFRWASQLLSWASTVVVARLLDADAYGIVALATIFVSVSAYFTEHGAARVIMVRAIDDERTQAQLHLICIAIGGAFTVALMAAAGFIGEAYGEARLADVLRLLAITPLLGGVIGVPMALLQRRLDYGRIARVELARALGQTGTVLLLAWSGAGYWSLPIGIVVSHLIAVALLIRSAWIAPLRPRWGVVRAPLMYAAQITMASVLWHAYSSADRAVAGRVLDVAAIGVFSFAWSIASLPGEKITNVLQGVAAPFFGAISHDVAAMRHYLLVMTESLSLIIIPVLAGFALVASDFVPLVFGEKWRAAVLPLQILVVYAAAQNLSALLNLAMSSFGYARVVVWQGVVLVALLPALFWWSALRYGIVGIAGVWAVVQPFVLIVPLLLTRHLIGLSLRAYAASLVAPLASTAVMSLAVLGVGGAWADRPAGLRLGGMIAVGAVTYVLVLFAGFRRRLTPLLAVWTRR